jgi:precorrin-6x reductase
LKAVDGNILLTTGSKELTAFTEIPDYETRLYPRVLPAVESIEACLSLGFQASHIIALQGPFSKELNIALMRQFEIKAIVTKDGGKPGGFPEKLDAARELGAEVIVIRRPDEEGLSEDDVILELTKLLEENE